MKKIIVNALIAGVLVSLGFVAGWFYSQLKLNFFSPFVAVKKITRSELPLEKFAINKLGQYPLQLSDIKIVKKIADFDNYSSYVFTYQGTDLGNGGLISGQINLPHQMTENQKVIVMLRGYVPLEIFESGVGTSAAAGVFAENGYITLAPDFLGYGLSDPEPSESWEARFIKPVHVLELISNIEKTDFRNLDCYANNIGLLTSDKLNSQCSQYANADISLGMWGHSNGGQIALSVLEASGKSIPTTLWAPVTAPFPYSILFFSDENDDEGKVTRRWLAQFELDYDVFDFSVTQHLDKLKGPITIHHGTADEAALIAWSNEFIEKVEKENELRVLNNQKLQTSTDFALLKTLEEKRTIEIELFTYPGADHNLRPSWNEVVARDVQFFSKNL